MTQPLALLWLGKMLLGSRLTEKLEEMGYRVKVMASPESLLTDAEHDKPLVVFLGVDSQPDRVTKAITRLGQNPDTAHLPVIAIISAHNQALQQTVLDAGARLAVPATVILDYLDHFLQQALDVQ